MAVAPFLFRYIWREIYWAGNCIKKVLFSMVFAACKRRKTGREWFCIAVRFIANTQEKGIKIALFSTVPETVAAQGHSGSSDIAAGLGGSPRAEGFGDSPKNGVP
jgi:hypothetical protein